MLPASFPTQTSRDVHSLLAGLHGRRAKTQSDRALAREVYFLFERKDELKVEGLHFYVFEGSVAVYGAVGTYAERDAVVEALSTIAGIGQIADHLTVLGA